MGKFSIAFLFCLLLACSAPNAGRAISTVNLPEPFNEEIYILERYWAWLKSEVDAPADLPWPRVEVGPLPRTVKMAFFFPTENAPWQKTRIVISPRSVDRAKGSERLSVVGELAHEIVHYVMLLEENGWHLDAEVLRNEIHHHCDHSFMRLTRQIAHFIWEVYHSNDAVRSVHQMVHLACWRDGHVLSEISHK